MMYRKDMLVGFDKVMPRDNKMYYISEANNLDDVPSNKKSLSSLRQSFEKTPTSRVSKSKQ